MIGRNVKLAAPPEEGMAAHATVAEGRVGLTLESSSFARSLKPDGDKAGPPAADTTTAWRLGSMIRHADRPTLFESGGTR